MFEFRSLSIRSDLRSRSDVKLSKALKSTRNEPETLTDRLPLPEEGFGQEKESRLPVAPPERCETLLRPVALIGVEENGVVETGPSSRREVPFRLGLYVELPDIFIVIGPSNTIYGLERK